jgi:hypothetical protein
VIVVLLPFEGTRDIFRERKALELNQATPARAGNSFGAADDIYLGANARLSLNDDWLG